MHGLVWWGHPGDFGSVTPGAGCGLRSLWRLWMTDKFAGFGDGVTLETVNM